MLIRRQALNLLQISCKLSLYSKVIFKNMRVADDTFQRPGATTVNKLKYQRVNPCMSEAHTWSDKFENILI